jgi:hypothetical protein
MPCPNKKNESQPKTAKAVSQIQKLLGDEEKKNPGTLRALAPGIPSHYLGFQLLAESNIERPRIHNPDLEKQIRQIILKSRNQSH